MEDKVGLWGGSEDPIAPWTGESWSERSLRSPVNSQNKKETRMSKETHDFIRTLFFLNDEPLKMGGEQIFIRTLRARRPFPTTGIFVDQTKDCCDWQDCKYPSRFSCSHTDNRYNWKANLRWAVKTFEFGQCQQTEIRGNRLTWQQNQIFALKPQKSRLLRVVRKTCFDRSQLHARYLQILRHPPL